MDSTCAVSLLLLLLVNFNRIMTPKKILQPKLCSKRDLLLFLLHFLVCNKRKKKSSRRTLVPFDPFSVREPDSDNQREMRGTRGTARACSAATFYVFFFFTLGHLVKCRKRMTGHLPFSFIGKKKNLKRYRYTSLPCWCDGDGLAPKVTHFFFSSSKIPAYCRPCPSAVSGALLSLFPSSFPKLCFNYQSFFF